MKNKSEEPEDLNLDDIEEMSDENIYKELYFLKEFLWEVEENTLLYFPNIKVEWQTQLIKLIDQRLKWLNFEDDE
ncbi:hypothetical protein UFOVP595_22 [uncultured Caudovirales phage]|uniref:Uncharacterized protein n=1 Tax=uncultured Caudovirales phage TaxID=2100421 RepID=A0A6J5N0H7_9CAUD|nr:hypothetical protein UFOVP595_22 [uncultured Caudovirales phage]